MTPLPPCLQNTNSVDLMGEAASILTFLSESLAAVAAVANADLSKQSCDGLAAICTYLQTLCETAAD